MISSFASVCLPVCARHDLNFGRGDRAQFTSFLLHLKT